MADKAAPAANGQTKAKKAAVTGTKRKNQNQLERIVSEAKSAFGDINTTGERKLRKRAESSRPAAPKKAAPKKKAAAKPAKKNAAAGDA